jgi:uncharacterized membrane protein (DUF2068 family)
LIFAGLIFAGLIWVILCLDEFLSQTAPARRQAAHWGAASSNPRPETLAALCGDVRVWLLAESLLALFHINPDRRYAQLFLDFADSATDKRLWTAASVAFTYGGLRLIEAYGLWRQRAWAEWIAFISGTVFLPLEIRELSRGITVLRVVLFLGNLIVVTYMYFLLRYNHRERQKVRAAPPFG